jgi:hypothetical protein
MGGFSLRCGSEGAEARHMASDRPLGAPRPLTAMPVPGIVLPKVLFKFLIMYLMALLEILQAAGGTGLPWRRAAKRCGGDAPSRERASR